MLVHEKADGSMPNHFNWWYALKHGIQGVKDNDNCHNNTGKVGHWKAHPNPRTITSNGSIVLPTKPNFEFDLGVEDYHNCHYEHDLDDQDDPGMLVCKDHSFMHSCEWDTADAFECPELDYDRYDTYWPKVKCQYGDFGGFLEA